jgi:cytochrome c
MTTKTQTFIGLDDIMGIHVECTSCHVSYTVPIEAVPEIKKLGESIRCPHCGVPRFAGATDDRRMSLWNFLDYLMDFRQRHKEFATANVPMRITLEIKNEKTP